MIVCKSIYKYRDKNNNIVGYRLLDINGTTKDINALDLKEAIKKGKLNVINLKLTSDGRLIDKDITDGLMDVKLAKYRANKADGVVESEPIQIINIVSDKEPIVPKEKIGSMHENRVEVIKKVKEYATKVREKSKEWNENTHVKIVGYKNKSGYLIEVKVTLDNTGAGLCVRRGYNGIETYFTHSNGTMEQMDSIAKLAGKIDDVLEIAKIEKKARVSNEKIDKICSSVTNRVEQILDEEAIYHETMVQYSDQEYDRTQNKYEYNLDLFIDMKLDIEDDTLISELSRINKARDSIDNRDILLGLDVNISIECDYNRTKVKASSITIEFAVSDEYNTSIHCIGRDEPGLDLYYQCSDLSKIDYSKVLELIQQVYYLNCIRYDKVDDEGYLKNIMGSKQTPIISVGESADVRENRNKAVKIILKYINEIRKHSKILNEDYDIEIKVYRNNDGYINKAILKFGVHGGQLILEGNSIVQEIKNAGYINENNVVNIAQNIDDNLTKVKLKEESNYNDDKIKAIEMQLEDKIKEELGNNNIEYAGVSQTYSSGSYSKENNEYNQNINIFIDLVDGIDSTKVIYDNVEVREKLDSDDSAGLGIDMFVEIIFNYNRDSIKRLNVRSLISYDDMVTHVEINGEEIANMWTTNKVENIDTADFSGLGRGLKAIVDFATESKPIV